MVLLSLCVSDVYKRIQLQIVFTSHPRHHILHSTIYNYPRILQIFIKNEWLKFLILNLVPSLNIESEP